MTKLYLFNTLSRKKEEFKPIKKGQVKLYGCGPTVYWYQHIGNMRRYVFEDILKRVLLYNSFKLKHVINITDVGHLTSDADVGEDKMMQALKREGLPLTSRSLLKIADKYTKVFKEDLRKLNILEPNVWSKATEHVKEMITLIKKIEKNKYTYKTSVGLIFDTSKSKDYAKLGKLKLAELKAGVRVKVDPERRNPSDFALWVTNQPKHIMQWDSPWGKGFPGWHIECSAMSMKYLGENFDIHTGGEEHIPIHHTNEIAQSEAATGKKWVNYWLHIRWLLLKGEKMAKSKGKIYTLSELEKQGFSPIHFRYFCLQTHYRKQLNFSLENLDSSKTAFEKTERKITQLRSSTLKGKDKTKEYEKQFLEAINDDLNTPKALQIFTKALDDTTFDPKKKLALLEKFDEVLGLGVKDMQKTTLALPKEIKELIEKRELLRTEQKWAEADIVRKRLKREGYLIQDTPEGSRVEKIKLKQ